MTGYDSSSRVSSSTPSTWTAIITRILSPDTVIVTTPNGQETRLTLSSIRAPKIKDPKESYYNFQGKEYLRKEFIGKVVQVSVEFVKPSETGPGGMEFGSKTCATVSFQGVNMAEKLVEKGLVWVTRHRRDDESR